ncbi:L-rhamnose mutarotase [Spirosoma oryzicola]|uniref:L-rhamnose mutarotase n=1 Tax=Spirosoma oryzicola TaxID=2898794 RepID=UPI001E34E763|nr:L-rhamnose mutarotase [Spirosoma oryzicola]UHG91006.1 L-rhamnose mutarotase [Spirosoma oryzicola]
MEEVAFTMKLKPGVEAEYKRRHDEIWPELSMALTEAGVRDYSIYLDRTTNTLFAVQKRVDGHSAELLHELPVVQRWWQYMADLMDTNSDNSPVVQSLERMFHLD